MALIVSSHMQRNGSWLNFTSYLSNVMDCSAQNVSSSDRTSPGHKQTMDFKPKVLMKGKDLLAG
eukprot:CAMPEP_0173206588 /NCGR_PEP_ID=MMETSP1141-20130122/21436_1 /TAXON_ID=483371 /ORGANISM="non described non described, Strain CCMP2298" /LENGTH=63 /DNA_ID=CAMNT_0014132729 /DNA_START=167 /DNA_END=358 /DNA_ORIENTATION=-